MELYRDQSLNDWYQAEIRDYDQQIAVLHSQMREILGIYYYDLYDFFYSLLSADYHYIVLMARRCLVLFQIFMYVYARKEPELCAKAVILSDRAVNGYKEQMKGKRVLLVDDIMIHGRTVQGVYDQVVKYIGAEDLIDIKVFFLCDGEKCLEKRLLNKVNKKDVAAPIEWRNLSNKIVQVIYLATIPYTSFVGAYYCYDKKRQFKTVLDSGPFDRMENHNIWQKEAGSEAIVYFYQGQLPSVFNVFAYENCLRYYYNKVIGRETWIPYSFTKGIKAGFYARFFDNLAELLPEKCVYLKKSFICGSGDEDIDGIDGNADGSDETEYKARLFNALISYMYGIYCFSILQIDIKNFCYDFDTLAKSFSEEISIELRNLSFEDLQGVFASSFEDFEEFFAPPEQENESLLKNYKKERASGKENIEILKAFFAYNGEEDEKRAKEGSPRLDGISADALFNTLEQGRSHEMAADLINIIDSGFASATCLNSEDSTSIATMFAAGEQSYRWILHTYPCIVKNIISLGTRFQYIRGFHLQSKDIGRQEIIENYLSYLEEELKDPGKYDFERLREFTRKNINSMEDWNLISVFENQEAEDPEENKRISDLFSNYVRQLKY